MSKKTQTTIGEFSLYRLTGVFSCNHDNTKFFLIRILDFSMSLNILKFFRIWPLDYS